MSTQITLLCFGQAAEITGRQQIHIDNPGNTDNLQSWLHVQFPQLNQIPLNIAVNREIAKGNATIPDGAEIALLPPFSGG